MSFVISFSACAWILRSFEQEFLNVFTYVLPENHVKIQIVLVCLGWAEGPAFLKALGNFCSVDNLLSGNILDHTLL